MLTHTTWMNSENIMLREIGQTRKDKYCNFLLIWVSRIGRFIETESRIEITRGKGNVS